MFKLIFLVLLTNVAAVNFTLFYNSVYFDESFLTGVTETLNFILDHSFRKGDYTLFDFCNSMIHHQYPATRAIILLNSCELDQFYLYVRRPNSYVIFFTKTTQLLDILKLYVASPSWNPRARFMFVTLDFNATFHSQLMSMFFKNNFINNFIVCSISIKRDIVSIYSWDVLDLSQVYYKKTVKLTLIQDLKFQTNLTITKDLFPWKFYKNYNFMRYKIAPVYTAPYLINATGDEYPGAEGKLLSFLGKRINFTYEFITNPFKTWGVKIDGDYTETFSLLQNHKADIVVGMVKPNKTECEDFDCYFNNYLSDTVNWYVPRAGLVPEDETLKLLFTPVVWSFMFLTLGLLIMAWCFFNYLMEFNFIHGILNLWALILSNPVIARPNLHPIVSFLSFHMIIILVLFFNLIISTSFSSQLINALTNPATTEQIDSQEDLIKSDLKYGFHENVFRMLRNDSSPGSRTLVETAERCSTDIDCMNRTAFNRDYATCKTKKQGNFLIPKFYLDKNGDSLLYEIQDPIYWFPIAIVFRKGLPIFEHANDILLKYAESGIISKLIKELNEHNESLFDKKSKTRSTAFSLTFSHLSGIFSILIIGLTASSCIFLLEIIYFKFECLKI